MCRLFFYPRRPAPRREGAPCAALPPPLSLPSEGHSGNDRSPHTLGPLHFLRLHLSWQPFKAPCKSHPAASAAAAAYTLTGTELFWSREEREGLRVPSSAASARFYYQLLPQPMSVTCQLHKSVVGVGNSPPALASSTSSCRSHVSYMSVTQVSCRSGKHAASARF